MWTQVQFLVGTALHKLKCTPKFIWISVPPSSIKLPSKSNWMSVPTLKLHMMVRVAGLRKAPLVDGAHITQLCCDLFLS